VGLTESPSPFHASGHISGPELFELVRQIAPARVVPVHTTTPQKFQAEVERVCRTDLEASAKAAVTSLRSRDVDWAAEDHDELLATADESLDRLTHLVDNLLDMSRLQAGALSLFPRPAGLDEIVSRALDNLDPAARGITVDIPDSLPEVNVDPAILERVIVNLTENALRYSPPGRPPRTRWPTRVLPSDNHAVGQSTPSRVSGNHSIGAPGTASKIASCRLVIE